MKLVVTSKNSFWLDPWMSSLIEKNGIQIEKFDPNKKYGSGDILNIGLRDKWNGLDDQYPDARIIIEGQGESNSGKWGTVFEPNNPRKLFLYGSLPNSEANNVIFYDNFFWHQLALDYLHRGYNKYSPAKTYKKKFLMPIRNWKGQAAWRREVFEQLQDIIPDSIYSMYEDGIYLPGSHAKSDIREINYDWFNDTHYSLTLESYYDSQKPVFKTEKIFKPLAFYHPFQVIASPGFLKNLRDNGFATFENLFDESYDDTDDIAQKISVVKKNVFNYSYEPYDNQTMEKLKHNHEHFYNTKVIFKGIQRGFIDPIKSWVERTR